MSKASEKVPEWLRQSVEQEVAQAELGDARRNRVAGQLVARLSQQPAASLANALEDEASLEAAYRLLNNEAVSWEELLSGHALATSERAGQFQECLAIHDTTEFVYPGDSYRAGLGPTTAGGQGFFLHAAVAVSADGERIPLGTLAAEVYTRPIDSKGVRVGRQHRLKPQQVSQQARQAGNIPSWPKQSRRWMELMQRVEQARKGRFECIHVMDREGDIYEVLKAATQLQARFVIRACQNRAVFHQGQLTHLFELARAQPPQASRQLQLSERLAKARVYAPSSHPLRKARQATVAFSSTQACLRKPDSKGRTPQGIEVNLVRVWEPQPPPGEPAVEWFLLTAEKIESASDVERIVDIYRARWLIEEFFKALKTGCAMEQRQQESFHALANILGLCLPIAWRLLLLRALERSCPSAPASLAFTPRQLLILAQLAKNLPRAPSLQQALRALARRGGHLKRNGAPGWQTLWRGFRELQLVEIGWMLADKRLSRSQKL
jgi:hypothetical protein